MTTKQSYMTEFLDATVSMVKTGLFVTIIVKFKAIYLFLAAQIMAFNMDLGKFIEAYSTLVDVLVKTAGGAYIIIKVYLLIRDKVLRKKVDKNSDNNNSNTD